MLSWLFTITKINPNTEPQREDNVVAVCFFLHVVCRPCPTPPGSHYLALPPIPSTSHIGGVQRRWLVVVVGGGVKKREESLEKHALS